MEEQMGNTVRNKIPIKVHTKCITLRDTGTTTLLIHQDCVRPQSYTGEYGKVEDFKGWHKALVLDQPLDGIDLIIGNVADVKECTEADITHWQNHHDINKSMAITRSRSRKEKALEKLDQNYTQPQPIAEQTMLDVHDEVKMNNNNETENSGEKNLDHVHDEEKMNDSNDNETENNVEGNYNVPDDDILADRKSPITIEDIKQNKSSLVMNNKKRGGR
ncbi:hypothetical protein HELRODRAFT_175815 [Helobdella robusta]|uniref:Uncharacterized protein n=1 Tax=Helobdella robusta TaxID=6412 RepID=T1F9Q1_HELRO|nr:hypothetical protein HELRODRAFT_175815 [Helobdella robusta]ESO00398.1 hypothetical protein HELRODRAFT_175815 [Helobdella robusta]